MYSHHNNRESRWGRSGRILPWLAVVTAAFALVPVTSALAWGDRWSDRGAPTACERTAKRMGASCTLDAYDNYQVERAVCLNIGDDAERRNCRREAYARLRERLESCGEQKEARNEVCDLLAEDRYDPDPLLANTFVAGDDINWVQQNPYLSLVSGRTNVLHVFEEEDGESELAGIVVEHMTDETREINGVDCRVMAVAEFGVEEEDGEVEYELEELTDDWFALGIYGDVYYCGELARNYEDELLVNLDGSFESGRNGAKAGTLIRAVPTDGAADRQEYALGGAEDVVEYIASASSPTEAEGGENSSFECDGDCLRTHELSALEPGDTEFKFYKYDIGFVLAVALEDGEPTGEREELACTGDSLGVLEDPACGTPAELRESLCDASEAFCTD